MAAQASAADDGAFDDACFAASPFRHLATLTEVRLVVDQCDEDDALALALTASPFYAAVCRRGGAYARFSKGVRTRTSAMWTSSRRLEWARSLGCPWSARAFAQAARANGCEWDAETCADAAEGGHLEVLQWARANGCPWDEYTFHNAAANGHMHVVEWARDQPGCPWPMEWVDPGSD